MKFGASTSNEDLAKAITEIRLQLMTHGLHLALPDMSDILAEAATRIDELDQD